MARVSAVAVARRLRRIHAQSRANGMSSPPIPSTANLAKPVMLSTSHPKVLSEDTGNEGQRQEHGRQDRQLLHCAALAHADPGLFHGDDGHVRLQGGGEQVLLQLLLPMNTRLPRQRRRRHRPELRLICIALDASEDGE